MIIVRLLSPEPVGWLSTTNFTRASEPTLSWNQLHQLRMTGEMTILRQQSA